jgi:hypothetical protein
MRKQSKWLTVARGYETSTLCQETTLKLKLSLFHSGKMNQDAATPRESFDFMDS